MSIFRHWRAHSNSVLRKSDFYYNFDIKNQSLSECFQTSKWYFQTWTFIFGLQIPNFSKFTRVASDSFIAIRPILSLKVRFSWVEFSRFQSGPWHFPELVLQFSNRNYLNKLGQMSGTKSWRCPDVHSIEWWSNQHNFQGQWIWMMVIFPLEDIITKEGTN